MYQTIHFKLRIGVAFTFMVLPELLAASNFGLRHNPYRDTGKHHVFETPQAIKDKILHRYESNNRMKKVNALQVILDNFPQQGVVSGLPAELGLGFMFSYLKAMLGYDAEQPIDKETFSYLMKCQKESEQWIDYDKVFHLEYDVNDYQDKSGTLYQLAQSKLTQAVQSVVEKSEYGVYSLCLPGNLDTDKQWLEKETAIDQRVKLTFNTSLSDTCDNPNILNKMPKILLEYRQAITDPNGFARVTVSPFQNSNLCCSKMSTLSTFTQSVINKFNCNFNGSINGVSEINGNRILANAGPIDSSSLEFLFRDKNPSVCTSRLAAILLNLKDHRMKSSIQFSAEATIVDEPAVIS